MDSLWIVQTVCGLPGQFVNCPDSFWIVRTVFGLTGQFQDCLDSFLSVGIVCRLSGQFPDYPDSFWIVRTVSGLSGKFLDYPDSFLIVRTVSEFFRKFLDYSDNYLDSLGNFLVTWIVFSLFWDRYELKRGNIYIIAKTFRTKRENRDIEKSNESESDIQSPDHPDSFWIV